MFIKSIKRMGLLSIWRGHKVIAGLLFAFVVQPMLPVNAQPAPEFVRFKAEWRVTLKSDGQGTDSRGAQWLALLGGLGGQEGVATAQDQVTWPAQGSGAYRIDSTLTPRGAIAVLLRRLHWVRGASGEVRDGRPELLSASNQRGDSPATLMHIEHGRMQVTTAGQAASAPAESTATTQPAPPGLTDPLTLSWGYLQRPLPTRAFTVPLLINDKVQTAHITPQRATLQWQGQEEACTLLDAHSAQSSATLRIWLRQSDGLPLQVELGMGDRYGLDVVQTLAAAPDGLPAVLVQH
ncbi:hypothetical protein [Thiomonas intermedia]|uniref:hypothetical protein n=1 Tax=Thiomonas intermedia TaxID=926 RepID=UPI001FEBC37E|nr:hypothetical protein [Thiomonas intermedia]